MYFCMFMNIDKRETEKFALGGPVVVYVAGPEKRDIHNIHAELVEVRVG